MTSKSILFSILFLLFAFTSFSQQSNFRLPQLGLQELSREAESRIRAGETFPSQNISPATIQPGAGQLLSSGIISRGRQIKLPAVSSRSANSDTLFVLDTMNISGDWFYQGTIVIALSGQIRFKNANATILGDIYLFGDHALLQADSSNLYIPQAYFYQRVIFATGGSKVSFRHTTVDHSDLSHNIILVDSATLELIDVTNKGFTTNGIYADARVFVDGTNQAGEYVILDRSKLEFRNANTVLLWHQFPGGSSIDFTFPDADTVASYHFINTLPGISGVNYEITLQNCTDVMWGMMPENNTNIHIHDSKIRSIGLWFMQSDTVEVQGLVDRSKYTDYTAQLTDRSLRLTNSEVETWSLYPMKKSVINMNSCIVGEVGTGGRSYLMGQQYLCDGSGGYVWASDSSTLFNGFAFVSGFVRSQAHGMVILAYSSLATGFPSALQNSLLMVLQCNLPQEPKVYDKSVVWFANIEQPFEAAQSSTVQVKGSAWIDKGVGSTWMEFRNYRLYYQAAESEIWTEIPVDSLNEKRDEVLANWNTAGLDPGQYLLKLVLTDEWGNKSEALKGVLIQPSFGVREGDEAGIKLYPNPAHSQVYIETKQDLNDAILLISDASGRQLLQKELASVRAGERLELELGTMPAGCYVLSVSDRNKRYFSRLILQ